MLDFRILGPLEVLAGAPIAISGRNQRSLLTLLLLRVNETVSAERLINEMWGEQPPKSAAASLQNTVSQLRKLLGPGVLVTRAPGYLLALESDQLDLGRFERLVCTARAALPADRARLLREALALWRGPALADSELSSSRRMRRAAWKTSASRRPGTRRDRARARAARRGSPPARLAAPRQSAARTPARAADARAVSIGPPGRGVETFHDGRRLLVDELGIEPSRALQQLYAQILRQERVLEPGAGRAEEPADDSDEVWEAIKLGRLVPVLGSGVSLDGDASARDELAEHLARAFDCPRDHSGDLAKVAQYVVVTRGVGPLYDELHAIFSRESEPQPVHRWLAQLPPVLRQANVPQQLIVTTQYDCALEQAFDEAGEPYDVVAYISLGRDRGKFLHRTAEGRIDVIQLPNAYTGVPLDKRPVILKIHGDVDRSPTRELESFVVSEDDYIAYLAESGLGGVLPVTLAARLRRSHLLFLGYGLLDWTLRVFLHRLWSDGQADYRSWAVQPSAGAIEREFWKKRGVEPSSRALDEFVSLLRAHVTEGVVS